MSKFFYETQKARHATRVMTESDGIDVEAVLDTIKQGDGAASGVLESRVQECRRISLAQSIKSPAAIISETEPHLKGAAEACRTLRTRLMRLQTAKGIRSIMITSAVPGDGKTLTSLNLALSWARLNNTRVLLIDGDLRSRGLTRLIGLPESPGLSEVLSGASEFDRAVTATEHENLFVVGAGSPNTVPTELFAGSRWAEFIAWCNEAYSMIIVDSPPIHGLADAELISASCDGVVMIVKVHGTPRELAQKCTQRIDAKKLLGVVLNGLASGSEHDYDYYNPPTGNQN
jgi:protein-tyrosine kinase